MSKTGKYLAIQQRFVLSGMSEKIYYQLCQKSKILNNFLIQDNRDFPPVSR